MARKTFRRPAVEGTMDFSFRRDSKESASVQDHAQVVLYSRQVCRRSPLAVEFLAMSAPQKVLELVDLFHRSTDAYHSPHYFEAQVRQEFINPLFKETNCFKSSRRTRAGSSTPQAGYST